MAATILSSSLSFSRYRRHRRKKAQSPLTRWVFSFHLCLPLSLSLYVCHSLSPSVSDKTSLVKLEIHVFNVCQNVRELSSLSWDSNLEFASTPDDEPEAALNISGDNNFLFTLCARD